MLVAFDELGRRVVGRDATKDQHYFCTGCKDEVIVKQGRVIVHHFAHRPAAACDLAGETVRHMDMKMCMLNGLAQLSPEIEYPVLEGRRRADLFIAGDPPVVIECQHSSLSLAELERRRFDYNQIGELAWVFDASLIFGKSYPIVGFTKPASKISEALRVIIDEFGCLTLLHHNRLLVAEFGQFSDERNDQWGHRVVRRYRVNVLREIKTPWSIQRDCIGELAFATMPPPRTLRLDEGWVA